MTYEQAKQYRVELEAAIAVASANLKSIPGVGTGSMGLTPDNVKNTESYRTAKSNFNATFKRLQQFNAEFVKQFKNEIKAERNARRPTQERV